MVWFHFFWYFVWTLQKPFQLWKLLFYFMWFLAVFTSNAQVPTPRTTNGSSSSSGLMWTKVNDYDYVLRENGWPELTNVKDLKYLSNGYLWLFWIKQPETFTCWTILRTFTVGPMVRPVCWNAMLVRLYLTNPILLYCLPTMNTCLVHLWILG